MKSPVFLASLLAVPLALTGTPQADLIFRSDVSLVRVDIEVLDSSGEIVSTLKADDFRVLDENVPQAAAVFSFEKEPLDLILLFDTGSGMKSRVHEILRAVELGFHELQNGDRACVRTFTGKSVEIAPFTPDMDAVNSAILLQVLASRFGGKSDPAAAADEAAFRFRQEPVSQRRRAVLMISDTVSAHTSADEQVIHHLWHSDAVLGQLVLERPGSARSLPRGANVLADATGGAVIVAGNPGPAFQDSLRRLRRRYTFYYPMPNAAPGSERRIDVQLSPDAQKRFPRTTIRARTGYIVEDRH